VSKPLSSVDALSRLVADLASPRDRAARIGANALIVALWLWLYRSVFDYLAIIFSREDFRTNQLVLISVIALIAIQVRKERVQPHLDAAPRPFFPALFLALVGSLLYLVVERFFDINTLSASLFGLASYGLLGLWMEPRRWRQGFPATLLIVGVLPFGDHIQTFVGYPVRILTASIVRDGLNAAGISSVGVDTILVFENGISQVDSPCSGIKSLWTGALFLIAATWIERRPLNLRWLLIALVMAGLLLTMNLARVGTLVVVGQVMGLTLAAEMLHVPLGVLGFIAACAVAVVLLRLEQPMASDIDRAPVALARPAWLLPVLAVAIFAMGLVYAPRPQTGLESSPNWDFPRELAAQPMPLTPDEVAWFTRDGALSADRWRFVWRGVTGSMILITSTTWRAQHRPERCFEVYGLTLNDSRTYLIAPDFPVRLVSLGDRRGQGVLSATYWFQSVDRTTDDYGARMWADLSPQRARWVLVSILFDRERDPQAPDVQALYAALHATVARTLGGVARSPE
jgi:exosortase O